MRSQLAPQMLRRADRPLVSAGIGVQQGWRGGGRRHARRFRFSAAALPPERSVTPPTLPCATGAPPLHAVGVEGDALDHLAEQQAAVADAVAAAQPPPPPPAVPPPAAATAAAATAAAPGQDDALDWMMR